MSATAKGARLGRATAAITSSQIEACIHALLEKRSPSSICPSDVARALAPDDFRPLMPRVRSAAGRMVKRGEVVVTQKGRAVDVATAHGPICIVAAKEHDAAATNAWAGVDFRAHPEKYRVGRGEQGVLTAEPYKSELLPLWRFRTPEVARASADALWKAFVGYRRARDFVGMDMARKFIQMGFTRARRYARHRGGRKYGADGVERGEVHDAVKEEAGGIFKAALEKVEGDRSYRAWREGLRADRK